MLGISSLLALVSASLAMASPALVKNGVNYTVFEHAATGSTLSFVSNSGICETTPGVNQFSGYLTVGSSMSMFFWFFEARNSPTTAPLALWLNGGPGCSSMIGLFQENGPCTFNNAPGSTPVLNPNSWNNVANMLYVDQPIGTGFSFGTDTVTSTITAAPFVWNLLQAFYAQFPTYENRNFGLFTESYGGHYGPEFASYFESQNAAIALGTITGVKVPLVALGINNGWFDPTLQYKAYIDYSLSNPYRALITSSQASSYLSSYNQACLPALNTCISSGTNSACSNADKTCFNDIEGPISTANFDVYDLRAPSQDPFPPETYVTYLQTASIQSAIGAQFQKTGDDARSFLSTLSTVVQSGIQVLIWAGDADWICNTAGVQAVIAKISFAESAAFNAAPLVPYTVNGVQGGTFKTAGNSRS
ncbi:carboxypeptidase-like protein S1 [Multifurca ochricompacta]|uniref:Carboxypeptidase n=1 Tax=Multifurca ochricompacta TaxID=376703 RepID=A0AAD4M3S7_9AGAM|nr:carboxypeptidase-like protein S1 [Multifurca ochricompacta]